ncbi:unnamed protein product [Lactuca saligna]|uniref:Uncharacterized protein n=1 Tax=Lactuca saligna TaxID=75948 RepID=A0AA36DYZ6_LACSI|nr:unnamed protein product [Lactuca saligna]
MPRDDNCLDVSNHFLSVVSHYRGWCYAFSLLIDSYAFYNQGAELMELVIGVYDSSHSKRRSDLGLEVGGSWSDWKYRKLGNENGRGTRFEYHSLLLNIIEFEAEKKGLITKLQVEEKICLVPDRCMYIKSSCRTLFGHVCAGFGVELSSWFNSCESAARKISFFFTETFSGLVDAHNLKQSSSDVGKVGNKFL